MPASEMMTVMKFLRLSLRLTFATSQPSAQANMQSANAALGYQRANYNRYKALYQKGLVSANDFESARLSYRQAEEQVAMMKESVVAAQESVRTKAEMSTVSSTPPRIAIGVAETRIQ